MDTEFWRQRWADGRIGFHRPEINPYLRAHLERLGLRPGDRVFVPLCGKSVDIPWLAQQGFEAVGVELSERAVEDLFAEHGIAAEREPVGSLSSWRGGGVRVYAGDYFDVSAAELGPIAAVWDRAALIALPRDLRVPYVHHLAGLVAARARVLLVTMAYPDDGVDGPPFSVTPDEVASLYAPWFEVTALERDVAGDAPGDLNAQGVTAIRESVWLLERSSGGEALG